MRTLASKGKYRKSEQWNVHSSMDTNYLTPSEVAQRLRVDDTTVRRWIHVGILEAEAFKQGKRVRYRIQKSVVETIEQRGLERHRILV